ncbi:MAG TPA: amino acid ABC transporter ATP-binding protein [Candidatus Baltobacteraceae bacterium]|nr:amino acid ABC transporter ATP-binding protein [Candidatus Baltobacteraceae bacterium]
MGGELVVQIRGVRKSFGANQVLDGVDLDVHKGEVVVVIGPSGGGKTTLLRCINLLETYDEGSIRVDGVEVGFRDGGNGVRQPRRDRELARIRADIGMVFQLFNLFPHLTARENVMLGLRKVRGLSAVEARQTAERWLTRVGLGDKFESLPSQLSGGQQQRVGIARAVAMGPKVLLLDEITSALDPELVGEVLSVVQELARDGMTMIVVTHEMTFARDVATRIVFMEAGRIQIQGTPREVLSTTGHDRLKAFLARIEMKHH